MDAKKVRLTRHAVERLLERRPRAYRKITGETIANIIENVIRSGKYLEREAHRQSAAVSGGCIISHPRGRIISCIISYPYMRRRGARRAHPHFFGRILGISARRRFPAWASSAWTNHRSRRCVFFPVSIRGGLNARRVNIRISTRRYTVCCRRDGETLVVTTVMKTEEMTESYKNALRHARRSPFEHVIIVNPSRQIDRWIRKWSGGKDTAGRAAQEP